MITWNIEVDKSIKSLRLFAQDIFYQYKSSFIKPEKIIISGIGSGQFLFDTLKQFYPTLPLDVEYKTRVIPQPLTKENCFSIQ